MHAFCYRLTIVALAVHTINLSQASPLPSGGSVTTGTANIHTNGSVMTVQQNTHKLGINWQSFNIGAGNSVIFEQPSSSSIALNRVLGGSRSEIYGNLQANGRVFLINPNGVLFGETAEVNVGGLLATTKNITDADFAAGSYRMRDIASGGEVVNQGNLKAVDGGFIVLAGNTVKNQGSIHAPEGSAILAAGEHINLNLDAGGKLQVTVNGDQLQALIDQQGLIAADGGQVVLTTRGREMLQTSAINLEGVVRAQSIREQNGRIIIDGGNGAVVADNLQIDTRGLAAGETGGDITLTGQQITLAGNTRLDARGHNGGGTVLVGGEFQGQGELPHAQTLSAGEAVRIDASATENGNGGLVVLWSDQQTDFYGGITSRGGSQTGDGGTVEVSGKEQLNYQAAEATDTRAPNGNWGTLWLDPTNINITDGTGGDNSGTVNSSGGNITDGQLITELGSTGVNLIADTITDDGAGVNVTTGSGGALTLTTTTGAGTINLGGSYSINGGLVLNQSGDGTVTGVISGSGGLTKEGSGTAILTGNNTYTGTTTVNAGVLQIGTGGSTGTIGSGAVTINSNGTLRHFLSGTYFSSPTLANNVSGSGNFILSGEHAAINGNWTGFTGTATIDSGARFRADNNSATSGAAHWIVEGTMSLHSNSGVTLTLGSLSGSGSIYAGGGYTSMPVIVGDLNENTTFSGGLGNFGATSFTKVGTGTLSLTRSGTAHGPQNITISGGTLAIGGTGNLTSNGQPSGTYTSTISIASGATFEYGSSADQTLSGVISGAGSVIKNGSGTLTLAEDSSYTGGTTVNAGIFRITNLNPGTPALANSATNTLTINNGGIVEFAQHDVFGDHATNVVAPVVINQGGILRNNNTYSPLGPLTLNGGNLEAIGGVATFLSYSLNGPVNVTDDSSITASGVDADIRLGGQTAAGTTFTIDADKTLSIAAPLQDRFVAGGTILPSFLTKEGAGTLVLTNNNSYSGNTAINDGTVQVGIGGTSGTLGSGVITNNGTLIFDRSDTVALGALASNAAGITGTGHLTARIGGGFTVDRTINLSGASSAISIGAGVNNLAGDTSGGDLTLSSSVTTATSGTVTLFSGNPDTANLVSQLNGATGTTQYKTYNAGYGDLSGAIAGTRNLYYRSAPTVSATVSGVDKTYDGLVTASPLANHYDYGSSTSVDGDNTAWTPNTSASGYSAVYDTAEIGDRAVTVNNVSFDTTDTTNGNFVVRGYRPSPNPVTGTGTISEPVQTEYGQASYAAAIRSALTDATGEAAPEDAALVAVAETTETNTGNEGDDKITVSQSSASSMLSSAFEGKTIEVICGIGIHLPDGVKAVPIADCNTK